MSRPFVIFSLPRSRSYWLSQFLSYGGKQVGHDTLIDCRSVADFVRQFELGLDGTCETGAVAGWQLIRHLLPEALFLVVRRPLGEVLQSLGQFGIWGQEAEMERRAAMLDALAMRVGVRSYRYEDLRLAEVCRDIFEQCLGVEWDHQWWWMNHQFNLQLDMGQRMAKLQLGAERISGLKAEFASRIEALDSRQGRLFN